MGGMEVGGRIRLKLLEQGYVPLCYVVDVDIKGYGSKLCPDIPIMTREDFTHKYSSYYIARGFLGSFTMDEEEILEYWPGCRGIITLPNMYEDDLVDPLTDKFYQENRGHFDEIRGVLKDETSRISLDAYITAKASNDIRELIKIYVEPQYFFESAPWKIRSDDILMEAGTYDASDIAVFFNKVGIGKAHVISCEPDRNNYDKALEKINRLGLGSYVDLVNVGCYSRRDMLYFQSNIDPVSRLNECGDVRIAVDKIDNLVSGRSINILKMDIEGSELEALKGAEQTIARCRPILMISSYHKRSDIMDIFDFVDKTVSDYSFYFRCHKPIAIDAVMYCVPNEKIKIDV